jgi:formamidopyrimidine-DNA glycosylase
MPELPEVETIKNDLRPTVEGRRFTSVSLFWPRMVIQPSAEELCQRLPGQVIKEVARRGKYLIFRLASGESLALHLRMSGSLLLRNRNDASIESSLPLTAVFGLDSGLELLFSDRRKLGTMSLVTDEREIASKLGPEPLDASFTPAILR